MCLPIYVHDTKSFLIAILLIAGATLLPVFKKKIIRKIQCVVPEIKYNVHYIKHNLNTHIINR